MLRIYCDSNIFRYLSPKHPSFNIELKETFIALKGKMLFTFSDAHVDDVKDTPKEYAEADMISMGEYVDDNYFMHDFIKDKRTEPYLATPIEAYRGKDYQTYNQVLNNPFDIDKLFDKIDDSKEVELLKELTKSFFDLPIAAFNSTLALETSGLEYKELMNKYSPNYSPLMTLGDFMKDIWPYSKSLLKDKKEVAELRRFIANYMNRSDYNFEVWGNEFNERFKTSTLSRSFDELVNDLLVENDKDDLYKKFNYTYILLELYNVTQERTKRGLKKFTLESLNTDALHAWHASFSDYLVTHDKGLQVKASIVYKMLGLPTKVLSLHDFINSKNIFLGREETYEKFSASLSYDLEHSFQLYSKQELLYGRQVMTYKPNHLYFNYFNRYQIIYSDGPTLCVFYCDRESHANFFMFREVELLVSKLIRLLGADDDGKGMFSMEEKQKCNEGNNIREWSRGDIIFSLRTSDMSWGSLLCLCLCFSKTGLHK